MGIQRPNISGNAGTATKLQTARQIGGVNFDGTANITLPGVNAAGNQNTSGNAATATTAAACTGNAATVTNGVYTVGDQTIGGSKTFNNDVNLAGSSSRLPSHAFHYEYDGAGNVYEHYYAPGAENVKNSTANLRVAATSGSYKTLQFSGSGLFKWDNQDVVTAANFATFNSNGALGGIGTYAMCSQVSNPAGTQPGGTQPGANLRYASADAALNGTPTGTWRCMGYAYTGDGLRNSITLWLRIA